MVEEWYEFDGGTRLCGSYLKDLISTMRTNDRRLRYVEEVN